MTIAIYTAPGSPTHCIMCEAFLDLRGYVLLEAEHLFEVVSMAPAADGERTLWRLESALHAGVA